MARIKVWESIPWGYEGDVSEIRIAAGDTSGAALVRAWLSGTISSGEAQA